MSVTEPRNVTQPTDVAQPRYQSFATIARTEDRFVLSVLCKRSYQWDRAGTVTAADEQLPLSHDIVHAERDDRNGQLLVQGRDTWPLKDGTDVIVTGHARCPGRQLLTELLVGVRVGEHQSTLVALGPRFLEKRTTGWTFSAPTLFSEVELSWWNAYGGMDPMVLPRGLEDTPRSMGKPVVELFPGTYPRNPAGTGYLITPNPALHDGLVLPQLEDPEQRLTPHLLRVDRTQWWRWPRPKAFGWLHSLWFPRVLHFGGRPYHLPECLENDPLPREAIPIEVKRGVLPLDVWLQACRRKPGGALTMNARMTREAAPELCLPFLRGDETVQLEGMSTAGPMTFRLPNELLEVAAWGDGKALREPEYRLHTLAIDADRQQFYLLHSVRFTLPDELALDLTEPDGDPVLPRCRVLVDGQELGPQQWPK
jgi:hypothetical protein